jgi:hypothetical protein
MEVQASAAFERRTESWRESRKPVGPWTVEVAAQVLSALRPEPVSPGAVRERGIALGLLRHPDSGRLRFSLRSLSRLFIVGYGLPVQAEIGSFGQLRSHGKAGRVVFVILAETQPITAERNWAAFQVQGIRDDDFLTLQSLEPLAREEFHLPRSDFEHAWARAGNGILVGVRRWHELPAEGRLFFGGLRDVDGAYHWNSAECDTDAAGKVLRY